MAALFPHSRPSLGEAEATAAADAVRSSFVGSGRRVEQFENAVAAFVGRKRGIATSSGSSALQLALRSSGVVAGDEVIIPAFVCRAVLNTVLASGATPVLADVDTADLTMSAADVATQVSSKTRAIVAVHMFGAPANFAAMEAIAASTPRITVIEDAASSLGGKLGERPLGSLGRISILSFASTKMITSGNGGMVLTDDEALATRVRGYMDYDSESTATGSEGFNYSMEDVQAAIGLAQLHRLPEFLVRRATIAESYSRALEGSKLRVVQVRKGGVSSRYRFVIDAGDRAEGIKATLQSDGIDARTGVAHFLHDYTGSPAAKYPAAESLRGRLVSLPIYPSLSDDDVLRISSVLSRAVKE